MPDGPGGGGGAAARDTTGGGGIAGAGGATGTEAGSGAVPAADAEPPAAPAAAAADPPPRPGPAGPARVPAQADHAAGVCLIEPFARPALPEQRHPAERAGPVLERARLAVDPVLRDAVDRLPARIRGIAAYHFGWRNADGVPTSRPAGKAIRPGLVLAAARAVGGPPPGTGPADPAQTAAAAAVELVHNFTLLHDDVIDRDPTRRHRPTAWAVFGSENAILAGDALLALALRTIAGESADRLADCVVELCEGQYDDLAFERREDVTLAECLAMAEKKTGALLGAACALGALGAGADPATVAAMDAFGRELGLAFQLTDDLLGIWGDPAVTGKPVGADLVARKKSLPVVAALGSRHPAAGELAKLYAADRPFTADEVRRAAEAVAAAGGRDWAGAQAAERVAAARRRLTEIAGGRGAEAADGDEQLRDLLAIVDLVTHRSS